MTTWKKISLALALTMSGCSLPAAELASLPKAQPQPQLRLNDIQVIGSHNSFRRMQPRAVLDALETQRGGTRVSLAYDHPSLSRQLDLGVRQFELDVVADPVGGRYAAPFGETLVSAPDRFSPEQRRTMQAPGFKALHLADWDYFSNCLTLQICLKELSDWSNRHSGHLPIMITIDSKDRPHAMTNVVDPLPLTAELLAALDTEVAAGLGQSLITPDSVRGDAINLRSAVLANQWPTLSQARGKFIVIFDVRPEVADLYRARHPSLAGRAMFAQYPEDAAEASVFIVQDPRGQEAQISSWVSKGFLVRTRSDAGTIEARTGDYSKLTAAITSGAQAISTDYYPGAPDPLGAHFVVSLNNKRTFACNPVRVRNSCPALE